MSKKQQTKTFEELWPLPMPEITIVTGGYGVGKSTFALGTGATPERTLVVDFEKSQSAFAKQLPLDYIDMQAVMANGYPKGYKMLDLYTSVVVKIDEKLTERGKYDVLILDNASPLEDAILAYVERNPAEFGHTSGQYNSMSGLKWGDVKAKYAQLLTRWGSKVGMIFIVVHLRDKWTGNTVQKDMYGKPVQEPKGKETLDQLSSLFVWLEHGPMSIPAAKVLKCRIDRKVYVSDTEYPPEGVPADYLAELNGEPGIVSVPVLPLRLPKCTWPAIREYMRNPADLVNPKPGESLTEKELSEDDRLKLRAIISHNESEVANVERMKLEAAKPIQVVQPVVTFVENTQAAKQAEPTGEITLDMLVELYGAEAIMAANEGKIPGTSEEINNLVMKLAGAA
ncbi:MAG: ATP-binding protein [Chloroflexi bacterium]|nr:ATP-binding protein [Chloroflexota bacterium]